MPDISATSYEESPGSTIEEKQDQLDPTNILSQKGATVDLTINKTENQNETLDDDEDESDEEDKVNSYSDLDLTESLIAEIEDGEYLCLICVGELDARSEIWNCEYCYRVYHLGCATAWAEKSTKTNAEMKEKIKGWSCPSCLKVTQKIPREYKCWCRKTTNPMYMGLTPHSCAQTCGHTLPCGHRCTSICHPGPHRECCSMGPSIKCFCGRNQKQLPCIMTSYEGWSCGTICNELLPCGQHRCKRKCHKGLCYDCDTKLSSKCYCGDTVKDLDCAHRKKRATCRILENGDVEKWTGVFACDKISEGLYTCKNHKYKLPCKPRTTQDFECPLVPKDSDTCPCGSSLVLDILGHPRISCTESIPLCGKVCGKELPCGHKCLYNCHEGDCPTCPQVSKMHCRCGQQIYTVPCSTKANHEAPVCRRRCTAKLQCRRHRCAEVCCKYERSARALEKSGEAWKLPKDKWPAAHLCDKVCNNLKNCKVHRCTEPCHTGNCPKCLESSDDDWVCPCGRTILRAPIRCGTMLPKCPHPCRRERSCGHPMSDHPCHDDSEECPKCFFMVMKRCECGKSEVKVPCSQPTSSCGQFCTKPLRCGHKCSKMCHKEGDCVTVCTKACGKTLRCGHKHSSVRCHYPRPCEEVIPASNRIPDSTQAAGGTKTPPSCCSEKIELQCKCGNLTEQKRCTGERVSHLLECNESCAILERNRVLAEAFGVDTTLHPVRNTLEPTKNPEDMYSEDLIDLYLSNPAWCNDIEAKLNSMYVSKARVRRFPPMKSYERMFIHLLANEAFNFKTESQDLEPHRNVVVYADWHAMTDDLYPRKPVMSIAEYVSRANIS